MAEFNSAQIASEFVVLAGQPLQQMKLHKLTYIAHGWHLAISNEPLILDHAKAWDNGPVFRLIWDSIRDFGFDKQGRILSSDGKPFCAIGLTDNQKSILEHVWKKYRTYNQFQLSNMTHQPGTPWTDAYFDQGRNSPLSDFAIKRHYQQLALAGRV